MLVMFAAAGSASAVTWGPTEDVVITELVDVTGVGSGEIGIPAQGLDFSTLTIESGGTLIGDRLYTGFVSNQTQVTVNDGGSIIINGALATIGYDHDTTMTQNGGLVSIAGWLGIGRSGSGTYNMAGGLLAVNSDDGVQPATGTLYMPPRSGYSGTMNFSGGTITLSQENWSASGHDILAQSWFNDLSGTAEVTWDGNVTTITAGVVIGAVTNLNDPMQVLEADVDGSAVQFTVVLDGDPPVPTGDTITVVLDPNENGDGPDEDFILVGADPDGTVTLTFTDADWSTPQTVTVKAIDDAIQDSAFAEVKEITLGVSSALGDPNFTDTLFSGAPVSITILDDESPAFLISKTSVAVTEDGTTDSYSLTLQNDPASPVTVNIGGTGLDPNDPNLPDSLPCQVTVNGAGLASLTFSAGDLGPKIVTVAAIDDGIVEVSPHGLAIGHVIVTTDQDYAAATISNVAVSITDNDARIWNFGDDVAVPVANHSFEDPSLSDGGVAVFGPENNIPGHEYYNVGTLQISDPTGAEWAAMYAAGHQQAPDGDQILLLAEPFDPAGYSGTETRNSICEYLIEPGPVSYTFEVSVGVPEPSDASANVTLYMDVLELDDAATFIARINTPEEKNLAGGDLVAGEWVDLKVCGVIPAGSPLIGKSLAVGVTGQYVHVDNFRLTVGNHPCDGCIGGNPPWDLTGPQGVPDCNVDLVDFSGFAQDYLSCNLYPECLTAWP
jgi:hypothetical protein